jgi:hypothetical protein
MRYVDYVPTYNGFVGDDYKILLAPLTVPRADRDARHPSS